MHLIPDRYTPLQAVSVKMATAAHHHPKQLPDTYCYLYSNFSIFLNSELAKMTGVIESLCIDLLKPMMILDFEDRRTSVQVRGEYVLATPPSHLLQPL
jgi:hypothetical protein